MESTYATVHNSNILVRPILHVSEIWWIIGSIFAVARGCLCLVQWIQYCKVGLQKLETSLYRVVQSVFRYLKPLRSGSRLWQMDGQRDRLWHNKCHPSLGCAAKKMWTTDKGCARSVTGNCAHGNYPSPLSRTVKLHTVTRQLLPFSAFSFFRQHINHVK